MSVGRIEAKLYPPHKQKIRWLFISLFISEYLLRYESSHNEGQQRSIQPSVILWMQKVYTMYDKIFMKRTREGKLSLIGNRNTLAYFTVLPSTTTIAFYIDEATGYFSVLVTYDSILKIHNHPQKTTARNHRIPWV